MQREGDRQIHIYSERCIQRHNYTERARERHKDIEIYIDTMIHIYIYIHRGTTIQRDTYIYTKIQR